MGGRNAQRGSGSKGQALVPIFSRSVWGFCLGLPLGKIGVTGIISGKWACL